MFVDVLPKLANVTGGHAGLRTFISRSPTPAGRPPPAGRTHPYLAEYDPGMTRGTSPPPRTRCSARWAALPSLSRLNDEQREVLVLRISRTSPSNRWPASWTRHRGHRTASTTRAQRPARTRHRKGPRSIMTGTREPSRRALSRQCSVMPASSLPPNSAARWKNSAPGPGPGPAPRADLAALLAAGGSSLPRCDDGECPPSRRRRFGEEPLPAGRDEPRRAPRAQRRPASSAAPFWAP